VVDGKIIKIHGGFIADFFQHVDREVFEGFHVVGAVKYLEVHNA
jgi:hypothetical protein